VVRIDDDPIATTSGAITPRAVDPGKHVIVARAGDGPEERVTVEVGEGETKDVDLAPQWIAPRTPPPVAGQVVYLRQTNPMVFVGFAASAVALTISGIAGVLAVNAAARAKDGCQDNYCPQFVRDTDIAVMRTWLAVSIIGGAAGIASFTVGVISISRPTSEKVTAGVQPYVGLGGAGVRGRF